MTTTISLTTPTILVNAPEDSFAELKKAFQEKSTQTNLAPLELQELEKLIPASSEEISAVLCEKQPHGKTFLELAIDHKNIPMIHLLLKHQEDLSLDATALTELHNLLVTNCLEEDRLFEHLSTREKETLKEKILLLENISGKITDLKEDLKSPSFKDTSSATDPQIEEIALLAFARRELTKTQIATLFYHRSVEKYLRSSLVPEGSEQTFKAIPLFDSLGKPTEEAKTLVKKGLFQPKPLEKDLLTEEEIDAFFAFLYKNFPPSEHKMMVAKNLRAIQTQKKHQFLVEEYHPNYYPLVEYVNLFRNFEKIPHRNILKTVIEVIHDNLFVNLFHQYEDEEEKDSPFYMFPSIGMIEALAHVKKWDVIPVYHFGMPKELASYGSNNERPVTLRCSFTKASTFADRVYAPHHTLTEHDFYHLYRSGLIPPDHKTMFIALAKKIRAQASNVPENSAENQAMKLVLTTFAETLEDMDFCYADPKISDAQKFWSSVFNVFTLGLIISLHQIVEASAKKEIFETETKVFFKLIHALNPQAPKTIQSYPEAFTSHLDTIFVNFLSSEGSKMKSDLSRFKEILASFAPENQKEKHIQYMYSLIKNLPVSEEAP